MASASTRASEKPSFFKVIQAKTIEDGRVDLPETFAQDYINSLSSYVFLKDPLGVTRKVKLTINDDGKLWLEDGWTEFVDHYSVEQNYLITFKYYGNSQFRVNIYSSSASEIAYHVPDDEESETDSVFQMSDDEKSENSLISFDSEESDSDTESVFEIPNDEEPENSVIFLDCEESESELTTPRKRKAHSQPQARSKKTKRSTTGNRPEPNGDEHDDGKPLTLELVQPTVMRKLKKLLKKDEHKAVKEALGFETKNPIFLLMMRPSYIILPLQVPVPRPFAEKYFRSTEGEVTFQVADGRTWPLKYKVYTQGKSWRLMSGWRRFAWENKLQLDDVCMFELIKRDQPTFKVIVYREIPIEKKPKEDFSEVLRQNPLRKTEPTDYDHEKLSSARALNATRLFKSDDPFFHVVMTEGYVRGENVVIPKDFCTVQNFSNSLKTLQLQVDKLLWVVAITFKDGVRQLSDGWDEFADYHDLRVGDVCVFQLTKKRPTVLKVTTFPFQDRFNK